ncbi:MAG: hypothetical protein F6J95_026840 [Leptolyngbya sp. SIO1E4]|nr:hypothetical protein [Leptolyngbya sp. SIO1E4]
MPTPRSPHPRHYIQNTAKINNPYRTQIYGLSAIAQALSGNRAIAVFREHAIAAANHHRSLDQQLAHSQWLPNLDLTKLAKCAAIAERFEAIQCFRN